MGTREKVTMYGLKSQKYISFLQAEKLLASKGFVLNKKNENCLFLHNKKESMKHFIVKAIIFKILRGRGRKVGSEIEFENGIVDLLDVDNLIIYEIENNRTKAKEKIKRLKSIRDIFVIDLKEVPDSLKEAEKYLREKVV